MIDEEMKRVSGVVIPPSKEVNHLLEANSSATITTGVKLADLIRRPELSYKILSPIDKERPELPRGVITSAEIGVKYEGYIKRELAEVQRMHKLEKRLIPLDIDYMSIKGLWPGIQDQRR